jgi:hypothetical protein
MRADKWRSHAPRRILHVASLMILFPISLAVALRDRPVFA